MKGLNPRKKTMFWIGLFLFLIPGLLYGQPRQAGSNAPPIAAPVLREGDLAIQLLDALGMGQVSDETWAESKLGEAGISPRNGWIADYPVTPDIMGELQQSLGDAVDAGRVNISKAEALDRLNNLATGSGVSAATAAPDTAYAEMPYGAANYMDAGTLTNYYETEGPPIYTYYAPPVGYYDLYGFVPYPVWYSGFWFPGFFVLHDFHRPYHVGGRTVFCSNHFHNFGRNGYSRIDPVGRFNGRSVAASGQYRSGFTSRTGFTSNTGFTAGNAVRGSYTRTGTNQGAGSWNNSVRSGAGVAAQNRPGSTGPSWRSGYGTGSPQRMSGTTPATTYGNRTVSYQSPASAGSAYHSAPAMGTSRPSSGGFFAPSSRSSSGGSSFSPRFSSGSTRSFASRSFSGGSGGFSGHSGGSSGHGGGGGHGGGHR